MRGGHGRKLLAGVAAWVVLTAAGTGCQSTAFRSLQGSWLPSSASPVTAKASPVVPRRSGGAVWRGRCLRTPGSDP